MEIHIQNPGFNSHLNILKFEEYPFCSYNQACINYSLHHYNSISLQSTDSQDIPRSISPLRSPIAVAAAVKAAPPADHLPLAVSPRFNFKDVETSYVGASSIGKYMND